MNTYVFSNDFFLSSQLILCTTISKNGNADVVVSGERRLRESTQFQQITALEPFQHKRLLPDIETRTWKIHIVS